MRLARVVELFARDLQLQERLTGGADPQFQRDRRDLESDDLRQGDHRLCPLRRRAGKLADRGERDLQELFFALALDDVREAARELRLAFTESGGRDEFISFECTPDRADETEARSRKQPSCGRRSIGPT